MADAARFADARRSTGCTLDEDMRGQKDEQQRRRKSMLTSLCMLVVLACQARAQTMMPENLCVTSNASSTRCCTVRDGVDRLDAPLMRYCADIACVANTAAAGSLTSRFPFVLQFSNAIIGQGSFEETAAARSFQLPKRTSQNISTALLQCEVSTLRKACMYVDPGDFSATPDGVCSACLIASNWDVYADAKPIVAPERYQIACIKVFRRGYVAPVRTTTTTTTAPPATPASTAGNLPPPPTDANGVTLERTTVAAPDDAPPIGLIAGAAAGGAAVLFILVVVGLLVCRSRGAKSARHVADAESAPGLAMQHAPQPARSSIGSDFRGSDQMRDSGGATGLSSARSSLGISAGGAGGVSAGTKYEAFDGVDDVRDKDARAQGNDVQQRSAEQQRQLEDIKRRQQSGNF
jgi:hypothetical protein